MFAGSLFPQQNRTGSENRDRMCVHLALHEVAGKLTEGSQIALKEIARFSGLFQPRLAG